MYNMTIKHIFRNVSQKFHDHTYTIATMISTAMYVADYYAYIVTHR